MRSAFDRLLSWFGLAAAILLSIGAGLAFWSSAFIHDQVSAQLKDQKITMPSGEAIQDPEVKPYLEQYAGQQMTTGDQAKAFADHYIWVHMQKSGGGKTYEEVSGEYIGMMKDPNADKAKVAELGELRQSLFMGNTLRGLLLNAYAFDKVGSIARIGGIVALVGGVLMLVLSGLGFRHARKVDAGDAPVAAQAPPASS